MVLALAPALRAAPASPAANGEVTRAQLVAQIKKVFDAADTNHDGFMSLDEFRVRELAKLNRTPPGSPGAPTKEQVQKLFDAAVVAFRHVDTNGDGKLSLAEANRRDLALFDAMDINHDGVLTVAEKKAAHATEPATAGRGSRSKLDPGR